MSLGKEQALNSDYSGVRAAYIRLLGFPAIGLQMRGKRILKAVFAEAAKLQKQLGRPLKICDAGCGRGAFVFELARRFPDAEITGLEYEAHLVADCRHIAEAIGAKNATFLEWDITKPLSGGPWDIVVNIETLEHIEAHEVAAANLFESVAPGGTLICHVPSYYSRMFGTQEVNIDVPGHVRPGYHGDDLVELLSNAGFEVSDWCSTYGSLETFCQRLSYRITGAAMRRAGLYALIYPFLRVIAFLGSLGNPRKKGTNVLAIAHKTKS